MHRFAGIPMLMVALCLVCAVGACRSNHDGGREQLLSFKCAGLLESGGCASYALGVTDLVVRPDAYQNLNVEVLGYLSNEFEDECLYPTAAAYEHFDQQGAIRLSIPSAGRSKYDQFRGKLVLVEGRFSGFAIRDITRVSLMGRPNRNQSVPPPPPLRPEDIPRK